MSSSFGGGSGAIRYSIIVDDSQAVQKLQSVGQQFQTLGNSTAQATQQMQQLPQTLDQTAQASDKVAQSQQQMGQSVKQSSDATREATTNQQSFGQVVKDNILSIAQIGTGILGLVSNYTSLHRQQVLIQRQINIQTGLENRLIGLRQKHAEAVAKYGANSTEAMEAARDLELVESKLAVTTEQISIRQEQLTQNYIGFAFSIVQTGVGIGQLIAGLKTYQQGANTAKVATIGLTNSMRALKIASLVLIPLIGLEIASQAIVRNWGGFRDWIEQTRKSLEALIPMFKPVIDFIWNLGESLTAIFTGDFDKIPKIWGMTAEGATDATGAIDGLTDSVTESSEAARKAKEEWQEFISSSIDRLTEISRMDKRSEKKDALRFMGIKGDAKDEMLDFLKTFERLQDTLEGFHEGIKTMETLNLLKTFGFDVDIEKVFDKFAYTMEDRFNKIGKDVEVEGPAIDIFEQFADALHEAAKADGADKGMKAIMSFLTQNPNFMPMLQQVEPELAADLQKFLDNASSGLKITLPRSTFELSEADFAKYGMGEYEGTTPKDETGGLLEKIQKSLIEGIPKMIKTVATELAKPATWVNAINAVGAGLSIVATSIWNFIKAPFTNFSQTYIDPVVAGILTPANWVNAVNAVGTTLATVAKAIWDNIAAGFEALMADPIGTLKTTIDTIVTAWETTIGSVDWVGVGTAIVNGLKDWFSTNLPQTTEAFAGLLDGVIEVAKTIPSTIGAWITQTAEDVVEGAKQLGAKIWAGILDFFSGKTLADLLASLGTGTSEEERQENFMKKPWDPSSGVFTGQGQISNIGMMFPSIGIGLADLEKGWDWLTHGGLEKIKAAISGEASRKAYEQLQMQVKALEIIKGITPQTQKQLTAAGGFNAAEAGITWGTAQIQKQNVAGAGQFAPMTQEAANANRAIQTEFSAMWTAVTQIMSNLATHWSAQMNSLGKNAKSGGAQVFKALNQAIENVAGVMNTFASHWSKIANSLGKNAKSAGSQIYKSLNQALENVAGVMNTFAKHWSKVCNSLINNAKSAAKGINSALGSIKDVTVTVRVRTTGATQFIGEGGTFTSFGKGGIISAARGYTTNGPQLAVIGDNPGGRETIAVVPHNDPWPTMSLLAKQFGGGERGGNNNQPIVINVSLPIDGTDLINTRNLKKMVKLEVGKERDKYM